MSQVTNFVTPGTPLTMAGLKAFIDACYAALISGNSGATAPASPKVGMFWLDTSGGATACVLKIYTAGGWVALLKFNSTAGTVTGLSALLDEDNMASDSATLPPSQQSVKAYIASLILDEDTMASNSATKVPTQQSAKAYMDARTSPPGYKNLAIDYVSASTATVTADEVFLQNSDGFIKRFTSLSETVDITKSGANGLDTGSEAVSTWYHIWAIGKEDGTLDCLLSLSATAPALPDGYTYKLYLGAVRNTSSGNFYDFHQRDNRSTVTGTLVINGGGAAILTAVDLSGCVPATAKKVIVLVEGGISGDGPRAYIASKNSGAHGQVYLWSGVNGPQYTGVAGQITQLILESQTLYYAVSGGTCKIFVVGYEF